MFVETMIDFLFWCAVVNYAILIVWFAGFTVAHERLYELHSRWFRLTIEQFDAFNYTLMGIYKIGVLLLFVTPYIALRIAG